MTDPTLRDSRSIAPVLTPIQPIASAPILRSAAVTTPENSPKVFVSEQSHSPDALGIETLVCVLGELATHKNAETPFCIGFLGGAGTGKSFALGRLRAAVEALTARAAQRPESSTLSRVQVVQADAAHLDGEPMIAIADAVSTGLTRSAPELVEEALRAVRDPHAAVAEAAEQLDQAQRRLHAERENLSQVEGRRARLFETVLYEMPGSQVDAYVRTNRPRIASRLQAFGFSGDPILNYKDLVASLAAVQGPGGWVALTLRSLWAFRGQARLLLSAIILAAAGSALGWAVAHDADWMQQAQSANPTLLSVATWFDAHIGAIKTLGQIALLGAGLAICVNLWRAFRFLQPVLRGVTLLKAEMTNRRHELDSAYAHQTRRVDGLAADVERAARLHADADMHAGKAAMQTAKQTSPFQSASGKAQAMQFMGTLATLLGQRPPASPAPQRVLFVLDNLDAVMPARARDMLDAAHVLLSNPAFVTVIAVDPRRLAEAGHGVEAHLEKWIQVPVHIDAAASDQAALVAQLVGQDGRGKSAMIAPLPMVLGSEEPGLDLPLTEVERQILGELAPLAGSSVRSLKRFVNLYRLTRTLIPEHWASLAFMLALETGGAPGDIEAMTHALAVAKPGAELDLSKASPRLSQWLTVLGNLESGSVTEALRRVAPIAASFSF